MKVIAAVLKDLYLFAVTYRFGLVTESAGTVTSETAPDMQLASALERVLEKADRTNDSQILLQEPESYPLLETEEDVASPPGVHFDGVGYTHIPNAFLYALPTKMFDGVIARLDYGESFQILNTQGKWMNVIHNDVKGWIHRDDVTESNIDLYPQFVVGALYVETNPHTVKLRTCIDDQFHAAHVELPLQDIEYVTYRLARKGRHIAWPSERPRVAGTWQRLLKGVSGVHLGVAAKTGSVMEYIHADNTGHVAYVESVYPDGSLSISEIGHPTEGIYNERTLSKDEWREQRPIFIEVA